MIHPAYMQVRAAVRRCLAGLGLDRDSRVLVACSGGADSLVLAAALADEARRVGRTTRVPGFGIAAGAVVVDHGVLPDSWDVAARVAETMTGLGLGTTVVQVHVDPARRGLEAAAREARYLALDAEAARQGAAAVLLGHTLDDQAETVLLGLARGSGTRSLAGMPADTGVYRRPLLGIARATIEQACRERGLTPWVDPSNLDTGPEAPLRNRVRYLALPALEQVFGPGVKESLARTATLAASDADYLDTEAARLYARAQSTPIVLDVATLTEAHPAVRKRALRMAAAQVGATALSAAHTESIDALVTRWRGQGPTHLPTGAVAVRDCGRLCFYPGDSRPARPLKE